MKKRAIHKVCIKIFNVAILNFFLFFLISLFIGRYTEVSHFVFICSKLYVASVLITHSLGILAGFIYWATGGRRTPLKAVTPAIQSPPRNPILNILYIVKSSLWRMVDFAEGVFWRLFDSWRKPDVEFFTRLSNKECIATLSQALERNSPFQHTNRPISGSLAGFHFYLYKMPLYTKGGPFLMLFGKLSPTPQGTYVRAWHRFHAFGIWPLILLVPIWLVLVVQLLGQGVLSSGLGLDPTAVLCAIMPPFAIVFLVLSIWISPLVGSKTNADLADFLELALEDAAAYP